MKDTLEGRAVGILVNDGSDAGLVAALRKAAIDAVVVVLSAGGAKALSTEGAAIDFLRNAFGNRKAIAIAAGGQMLLQAAGVTPGAGMVAAKDTARFIDAAKTRQRAREPGVRILA